MNPLMSCHRNTGAVYPVDDKFGSRQLHLLHYTHTHINADTRVELQGTRQQRGAVLKILNVYARVYIRREGRGGSKNSRGKTQQSWEYGRWRKRKEILVINQEEIMKITYIHV